jgi:ubiquinone/menaquinone biosynthesis C-methylase UbiE
MKINPPLPARFINPVEIINQMDVSPGSVVADFGCGSGYFSIPLAETVGEEGIIHSLDILPQALEEVQSKAKSRGLTNVIIKRANLESENGSGFGNEELDWVIIKDMLFQNKNKESILKEAYRVLKPGGKAFVMEWNERNFSVGPSREVRIPSSEILEIVGKQKFVVEKKIDAGDFHYAFVIKK